LADPDPQGLAFDTLAEDYDLGRPPWPPEMLSDIRGDAALDLAAGTGKLTRLLVGRFHDVTAVEPLAGMRAVLERNVPEATVVAGSAERIPLDDCSVDAAFVAEAFHWFDTTVAARELARVLRRRGTLLICFNDWLEVRPALPDDVRRSLREVWAELPPPGGPKVATGAWRLGFADAPFSPLVEHEYRHTWHASGEQLAAYYVSTSSMGALDPGARDALRAKLVEQLGPGPYAFDVAAHAFRTERT